MSSIKHFFHITLLRRGKTAQRLEKAGMLEKWASYRYLLMLQSTLKSIENQLGGPSETLIRIDPRYEPLVARFMEKNPLPVWCKIVLKPTLNYICDLFRHNKLNCTHVYLTRVDSDDLLGNQVKQLVLEVPPSYRTANFQTGFLYDCRSRHLTAYQHPSPPFYTDIYSQQELLTGKYPRRQSHNVSLPGRLKLLAPFQFCVVCHHGKFQDSSTWPTLRRAGHMRLKTASPALQKRTVRQMNSLRQDLEQFGCPHYKVEHIDRYAIQSWSLNHPIRMNRTPIITRSRFSPAGVHGQSNRKSHPRALHRKPGWKTAPNIRSKVPTGTPSRTAQPSAQSAQSTRKKVPVMKRNTIRGSQLDKERAKLFSPYHSRKNAKKRLQQGQQLPARLGYKLLKGN